MSVEIYLIVNFGRTISINAAAVFLAIPVLLGLNTVCAKIRLWEDLLNSFFFNGPLRALITVYLNVAFQVMLNSQFISFSSYSAMVATAMCAIVGYVFAYFPIFMMSLIAKNRKEIRKA